MGLSLKLKPFYLLRHDDVSGISGVGIVAVGVCWPNGKVTLQWTSIRSSLEIHDSMENLETLHSHSGSTEVIFGDPPCDDEKPKKTRKSKQKAANDGH